MKKDDVYTRKILSHLTELFDENCENRIDAKEISEDDNATSFFYALSLASTHLYNKITGDEQDLLGYNHICNRLIVQAEIEDNK